MATKKSKPAETKKSSLLSIKRTTTIEDDYIVQDCRIKIKDLEYGLRDGSLNLEQSQTIEEWVLVRNWDGKVVAVLKKEGACGPDHDVLITTRDCKEI